MSLVVRFLLVCGFALFCMRAAVACGHEAPVPDGVRVVAGARVIVEAACDAQHRAHGAGCCVVSCAMHCVLLPVALRLNIGPSVRAQPFSLPEPLRSGITHAPPLPPPIV
jgi:hypothetical protein